MPSIGEALGDQSQLANALKAGVETLSQNQTITFTKYVKCVLPIDGFVFWVRADLLSPSALLNASALNASVLNAGSVIVTPAPTLVVKGSLHYATDTRQEETETYGRNRVIFTAESEVQDLNQIGPAVLYIATFDGIRFAFSARQLFYRQAGLYHYVGDAVYSDMDSQIIDDPRDLDTKNAVVSNSLPLWLALNGYAPDYPAYPIPPVRLYPSFLLPTNLPPPYGAVHIVPDGTQAIQGAPTFSRTLSHAQLVVDKVRITFYGLRNSAVLDFIDAVSQYSLDTDYFGIMNMPVPRDEKRPQSELNAISMKKTVEFDINYYQRRANTIARQLILEAIPSFYPTSQQVA